ncbi:MAG: ADP-forming succinate--CoA ligase subunit beta [Candidatus Sumerlaeia bacterium]|nr:ADP-forming succinate--CoA ligase subunit beta [Candidatus Sumerlaeia bacterium]
MKIHEYQGKDLLAAHGVPTPRGRVATDADGAARIAEELATWPVVVKAQVHVGGRGKAGGVKLAHSLQETREAAAKIIGLDIKGITVRQVLVEPGVDIKREIYLAIVMDRVSKRPLVMASAAGGMDIEEVAEKTPEKLLKFTLPPGYGMRPFHVQRLADFLEIPESAQKTFHAIVNGLAEMFYAKDCSLAEINPLVITGAGQAIACDAKVIFDENALYKHPELESLRDDGEEEPLEVEARRASVNYVKLDGKIGCIVNGAGLAMATMDIVKHFGGEPANFLDIGGGAKAQQVADALRIITSDKSVNTIFFNIFGGIVRCDRVAAGILQALESLPGFNTPIVIRLIGTNDKEAHEMLKGTSLIVARTMAEGAQKAVAISRGATA